VRGVVSVSVSVSMSMSVEADPVDLDVVGYLPTHLRYDRWRWSRDGVVATPLGEGCMILFLIDDTHFRSRPCDPDLSA